MTTATKTRLSELRKPSPIFWGEGGQTLANAKFRKWFHKELCLLDKQLDDRRMEFIEHIGLAREIPPALIASLEDVILLLGTPQLAYQPEHDELLRVASSVVRELDRASSGKYWGDCEIDDLPRGFWEGSLLKLHEAIGRLLDPPPAADTAPKRLETLAELVAAKCSDLQIATIYDWRLPNNQFDTRRVADARNDEAELKAVRYAPLPKEGRRPQRTQHAGLLEYAAAQVEEHRND